MSGEGTKCWYVGCDTTIPRKVEYRPIGDGSEMQEVFVEDKAAMNKHLASEHPPKHSWTGGWS